MSNLKFLPGQPPTSTFSRRRSCPRKSFNVLLLPPTTLLPDSLIPKTSPIRLYSCFSRFLFISPSNLPIRCASRKRTMQVIKQRANQYAWALAIQHVQSQAAIFGPKFCAASSLECVKTNTRRTVLWRAPSSRTAPSAQVLWPGLHTSLYGLWTVTVNQSAKFSSFFSWNILPWSSFY